MRKKIVVALMAGLIIQVLTAWHSIFFHSDEYFQIIEFANYRYHLTSVSTLPWEFTAQIRPTLQAHFFALFYKCFAALGVSDRFAILSLLHVLIGTAFFAVSNYLIINAFRQKSLLPNLLWVNNLFWIVPFLRCRYSSETLGAFFWISATILLVNALKRQKNISAIGLLFLSGLTFSCSFFCRFQMLFAMAGVALWFIICYRNEWKQGIVVVAGFLAGAAINVALDRLFYGAWVFTPYRYFHANIIEGKANSFGTSPWWYYIIILLAVGIPLAGIALFSFFARAVALYKNPFALATLFFIIGHSITGHKEERFIFPVILVMVYLAAVSWTSVPKFAEKAARIWNNRIAGLPVRIGCYFSVGVNIVLALLLCIVCYKQPVLFIKQFNESVSGKDHVISFRQHPYETESNLRYAFLSENKYDSIIKVTNDKDGFLQTLKHNPAYKYCILLSDAHNNKLDYLLENKHAVVASPFVWHAAVWLAVKYNIIIPDLWICGTYTDAVGK